MAFYGLAEPVHLGMTCPIAILLIKLVIDTFKHRFAMDYGIKFSGGLQWT